MEPINVVSEKTISEQKSFLWKIPKFGEMLKCTAVVDAQFFRFQTGQKVGHPAAWRCYLKKDASYGMVGIYTLLEYPQSLTNLHANVRFLIKNPKDNSVFMDLNYNQESIDSKDDDRYGTCQVFDPGSEWSKLPLQKDGSINILVAVTVFNPDGNKTFTQLISEYKIKFHKKYKSDIAKLQGTTYQSEQHPTVFVSRDGTEIPVDGVILGARSEVFREIIHAGKREENSAVVKVNDMNGHSLNVLLEFARTGKLKENWKKVGVIEDLVHGAHKYNLQDLKEFLGKVVALVCTNDNCAKLLSLARTLEMKQAETQLFHYFKTNIAMDLEKVESFMETMKKHETQGETEHFKEADAGQSQVAISMQESSDEQESHDENLVPCEKRNIQMSGSAACTQQ